MTFGLGRAATAAAGEIVPPPHPHAVDVPSGTPDLLEGKTFVPTGTFDTLTKLELIELIESMGGVIQMNVSSATMYLVQGWDGQDFPPGHPPLEDGDPRFKMMLGRKHEHAVKQMENLRRKEPMVIIENDHGLFKLIRELSGDPTSTQARPEAHPRHRKPPGRRSHAA